MARPGPGLDRLLGRTALEGLLASLEEAAPGSKGRIVDAAGRVVGNAEAHHAATGTVREYPIVVGGAALGTLIVDETGTPNAGPSAALTARALAIAAEQALNVRFLAAETLERYRELNALYEVGARIAGSLDATQIVEVGLGECRRVVGAATAVAILEAAPDERRTIAPGDVDGAAVADLLATAGPLLERVRTNLAADLDSGPFGPGAAFGSLLAVPLRAEQALLGILLLGRGAGRPAFTASDEKVVTAVAAQVAIALQNASLHVRELEARRMEEELAVGRRIQLGLLPLEAPRLEGWEIAAVYRAARQVGGDFYDFVEGLEAPDASPLLGLIVGDVAGKGVPAALMMAYTRAVLRSESLGGRGPAVVLSHANDTMLGECRRAALLVTAFQGLLDTRSGRLRYASAGHDWPVLATAAGEVDFLGSSGVMLGMMERGEFDEREVVLAPGDVLAIYTDGVTEARSASNELFGEERLVEAMRAAPRASAAGVIEAIIGAVDAFAVDAAPADDLTLVVVRRAA